jgi:GR25 family glycosyltransferase involved in LPS biosynthesis
MELKISELQPTICLNMIVKNESHIIKDTLQMLCSKIRFSYWVICDTGSTDNTCEIIQQFFKNINIPGELHDHKWLNFAHNRTLALNIAFNKTDLVFIFDADDEIHGEINMPSNLNNDGYLLNFGYATGISYQRILLVNNRIKWNYQSVVHEYINCLMPNPKIVTLEGDYYIVSGRKGSRSSDPNKYLNDAKILEDAYFEAKKNNDSLYLRYGFYCANSYKDAGNSSDAIKWYKIALDNENWSQEKYMCCFNLYNEYNKLCEKEKAIYYLVESFKYDTERTECAYILIQYYLSKDLHQLAYQYYGLIKNFYENKYLDSNTNGKLFVEQDKSNFYLPYYMILVADKVKNTYPKAIQTIIKMYEIIFVKKYPINDDFFIGNLLYNLQFFIESCVSYKPFVELFQSYIDFLYSRNCNINKHLFLKQFEKHGIKLKTTENTFSKDECKNSNKILFYSGFSNLQWNYTYYTNKPLGGSETALANLAKSFPSKFNIYVCGTVSEEIVDNVNYINLDTLKKMITSTPFHTIIVSRYIGFYEMFSNISFYQSFIWGHDVSLYPYGCDLDVKNILQKWSHKITGCVCQTEWHKNTFTDQYPSLKDKMFVINNGIVVDKFTHKQIKISNRFIYTSCSERGLDKLLELWPQIIENLPSAELCICSYNKFPQNDYERKLDEIIKQNNSIKHLGCLNKNQLYELMYSAEYWLYPTNFSETSCITAMEMLMSEVICIYYPIAGLVNTLGNYGIPVKKGNEINTILNLSTNTKNDMVKKGKEYALSCSWENRTNEWVKLIDFKTQLDNNEKYTIKVINLTRRPDRKNNMINQLVNKKIINYDFFEAIDGNTVEPNFIIKNLFKNNDFDYRKGIIGCALSHYTLWNNLIKDNEYSYYVVLEDDAKLVDNFKILLDKCINSIKKNNIEYTMIGGYQIKEECNNNDIICFDKIITPIAYGTIGYIISKKACIKVVNYLKQTGITRAIDHSDNYRNCLEMYTINKNLVSGKSVQVDGSIDSDIQFSNDKLIFDNIQKYTVSFTDWWIDEYSGGTFDPNNNFFTKLLSDFYNIQIVNPEDNPDILFYSVFGNKHLSLESKRKIFFSGEQFGKDKTAAFNITFDENDSNNCRLPLWVCYLNDDIINDFNDKQLTKYTVPKKTKFCSIICQQDNVPNTRSEIVEKLSKYKRVDCGGKFLNNIGYCVPRGTDCSGKIQHNFNYKFVIAFENKNYPGYVTEKICDVYKSKSIPIYWGNKEVLKDFNPTTFIYAGNFNNFDDLVEYIIKVDNDDELYASYFKEPILSNIWINILNDPYKIFFKNLSDCIIGNDLNTNNECRNQIIKSTNIYFDIGSINISNDFKIYYGTDINKIDITNKIIRNNNIIHIPSGDENRAILFGDPSYGNLKQVYIYSNNYNYVIEHNNNIYINIEDALLGINHIPVKNSD